MAANKFATMLHRKTNKLTLILVYAFLEWVLIFFLLLNSLFSYLIIKFADYFGLEKPCLWCSRLDHFFEPENYHSSYRSLVCEAHAMEISKLGYCSNHRKLAESQHMCEDCSSSSAPDEKSKNLVFFPLMKKLGVLKDFNGENNVIEEKGVLISECCCCGVNLAKNYDLPVKPFWGHSENSPKGNLIVEDEVDDEFNEETHSDSKRLDFVFGEKQGIDEESHSDGKRSDFVFGEKQGIDENRKEEEEKTEKKFSYLLCGFDCNEMVVDDEIDKSDIVMEKEEVMRVEDRDVSSDSQTDQHLEFYIDEDACHLIPIQMEKVSDKADEDFVLEFDKHAGTQYELVLECRSNTFEEKVPLLPIIECEEQEEEEEEQDEVIAELNEKIHKNSGIFADFEMEQVPPIETPNSYGEYFQQCIGLAEEEVESHNNQESEGAIRMQIDDDIEADISIGTDIHDHEPMEEFPSYCSKKDEEQEVQVQVEFTTTENNEIEEEEKIPDTPTSIDSGHHSNKRFPMLERRESNAEESLDGSVTSDVESGDGVLTVDKLKSALKAERKALNAIYAELEEERSASAVAANQTMAMINRLQEEKAAMQMEALQYQRMMEEQSEYDQEALQLMNELMVKREKERAELEKELELYRKRVEDYEAREKLLILKRRKEKESSTRTTSSPSYSNGEEESDGLSVDLNNESKDENGFGSHQENTPIDAVVYLEDSLVNFEEERLSILDQLKVLEEKLFTLSEEGEQEEEKEHLYVENGNGYNEHFDQVENGHYKEMNGRHNIGTKAKRLLPLFDATEAEAEAEVETEEEMVLNRHGDEEEEADQEVDSVMLMKSINKYEVDTKKLEIEQAVDHVYERLQALEADREFLKHCMTSLNKGDKGIQLLHEILQHLRDLRHVEARSRSMENGIA